MARPMNGRGRGRAAGRTRNNGNQDNTREEAKTHEKNQQLFNVGTAKQASNFVTIKKSCINIFRMEYKQGLYLATALEDGKEYNFELEEPPPLLLVAEKGTEEEILIAQGKNRSNEMNYKRKLDKYSEKQEVYEENKVKAYGFYGTSAHHK